MQVCNFSILKGKINKQENCFFIPPPFFPKKSEKKGGIKKKFPALNFRFVHSKLPVQVRLKWKTTCQQSAKKKLKKIF